MHDNIGNLVLALKPGESVQVGENITVTLVRIKGNHRAQIAFEAPKDVKVLRTELLTKDTPE